MPEGAEEGTASRPVPGTAVIARRKVFVSYASQDKQLADAIVAALERAGISCWIAPRDVIPGLFYAEAIVNAINSAYLLIVILSAHSVGSQHVLREVERASSKKRPLLAFRLDAIPLPTALEYFLSASHWLDASADSPSAALPRLVDAVRQILVLPADSRAAPPTNSTWQRLKDNKVLAWHHRARALKRVTGSQLLLIGLLLAIGGSLLWLVPRPSVERDGRIAAGATLNSIPFAKPLGDKSIAVLPFVDMSEKKDQEYFSDGLSEELIDLLSQIQGLQVIARTSSFYFKGKQVTIGDIAKTLGAANILEGSVRRAGNTIRVTAQLIRADNGVDVWSSSYDREITDIFKVEDEIAAAVVGALRLKLITARLPNDPERSESPEAYDQYLLGKQLNHRGDLEDYKRAVAADLKAVALDPGYAAAYAALSMNESHVADYGDTAGFDAARVAAEKAISIAPQLAAGYRARALTRLFTLDFPGGQADEQRALILAPGDSRVQNDYGYVLATFGRLAEAIVRMNSAIELDPLNSDAWGNLALYRMSQRDFPAARRAFDRALAITPTDVVSHLNLGCLDLLEGRMDDALAEFNKGEEDTRLQGEAMVAHTQGDDTTSRQKLYQLITQHAAEDAYQIATVYAWRGESDSAFQWLDRAIRQRDSGINYMIFDVLLTSLRTDPRYAAMLKKLKLSE